MEHMGWDAVQPIANVNPLTHSSTWSSPQQVELHQQAAANKGFSTMWRNIIIDPGFPTIQAIGDMTNSNNNEVDSTAEKLFPTPATDDPTGLIYSLDQETEVSNFGNIFSQQQHNLCSSAGSSQISDYVLTSNTPLISPNYFVEDHFSATESITNNNAKSFGMEPDGISPNDDNIIIMSSSAVSSRKRKAAPAEDAYIAEATPTEMIKFSDIRKKQRISDQKELTFGSASIDHNEYSSSSAEGGSCGFKLITAKRASIAPTFKKSSNINFQLYATSSDNDAPDSEAIAEMKEMIYRAAAFRPVNLGVDEVVEKPKRKNVKISSDPQTSAARQRRERISDRIQVLQRIVPGGNKMDTATMLDEAANYLRFLRSQVKALEKTTPTGSFVFSSYNFLPQLN